MDETPEKTTDPRTPPVGAGPTPAVAVIPTTPPGSASGGGGAERTDHRSEAMSRFNAALAEAKAGFSELGAEAKERANAYRGQATERVQSYRDQARSKGDNLSTEARSKASEYADQGRSAATEMAYEGKAKAAEALLSLSKVVSENAGTIDGSIGSRYGDYARNASRSLQEAADTLDSKSIEEIGEDTREFIRTSPGTAVGIAAVVGFMLGRTFSGSKSKKAD